MKNVSKTKNRFFWLFVSLSRGLSIFLMLYSLFSIGALLIFGVYNQNAWWIDFSFLPDFVSGLLQILLTVALGVFAFSIPKHIVTRILVAIPIFAVLFVAVINTLEVYSAAAKGTIILGFPIAFSVFVCIGLLCILVSILFGYTYLPPSRRRDSAKTSLVIAASFLLSVVLFPIGQMHCFGTTNYRVPVDAAVVLGAQVYPDGTPSPVLQDRLDTAIDFYKDGYTSVLVMSGGVDVDGTSEAQVMRNYALANGIADEDIIVDEYGTNTQQTAQNTTKTLKDAGLQRVAAVSNFYHLARIKMLYLAEDVDVVTVPSVPVKDSAYPFINVVREIPGWWYYWCFNLVK